MSLQAHLAALITAVGADIKALFSRSLPPGGAAGQFLKKSSGADYDAVWAAAGGGAGLAEVMLDFGAVPVNAKAFSFAAAGVTMAAKIVMTASASPAGSRSADELEMDGFACAAACLADGTITAFVTAHPGPVTGQYKFNYSVG